MARTAPTITLLATAAKLTANRVFESGRADKHRTSGLRPQRRAAQRER